MLREISLEKFKAFDTLEELSIKPLTILCGVNSRRKIIHYKKPPFIETKL